ncbi:hypothetical protein [Cesiribacter sp. SM1]|uniref:hypothetical protein n=1 Tax=Cesiribacter sp. SM1 TaxID=2861196 RepID=UPI001CD20139|nr:hypothetical protein [Cesiribacter sp. SM1]
MEAKAQSKAGSSLQLYDKPFFEAFIIALLLCLSPSKAIGLIIPFLCAFWFITRSKSGSSFKRLVLLIIWWGLVLLFYQFYNAQIGSDFNVSNGILSFVSYASIFIVLVFPALLTSEKYSYDKYAKLLIYVILFEGCWGIMQKILAPIIIRSSSGDVVEGTINPFSFIYGHSGFSNQFFAINIVCLLIFCFPFVYKNKRFIIHYGIGIIALLLASVGHVFYSFILATSITYFIFEGTKLLFRIKTLALFFTAIAIILSLFATLDPKVWANSLDAYDSFINGKTPKSQAVIIAVNDLGNQYPTMHLVGMGPGEYSSRTGIIASGSYFSLSDFFTGLPFLNIGISDSYRQHVLSHWLRIQKIAIRESTSWATSTMARPYFSILSVYTEFGGLGLLLLLSVIFHQVFLLKREYRRVTSSANKTTLKQIAFGCTSIILFLFLIGLYENYYETSQGIFVGILLILVMRSFLNIAKLDALQPVEQPEARPHHQEIVLR